MEGESIHEIYIPKLLFLGKFSKPLTIYRVILLDDYQCKYLVMNLL